MKYGEFQIAVIELAAAGTTISVANVVAALRVEPAQTEEWLDQMAREERLTLELDEEVGAIYYRVPGLTVQPARLWSPSFREPTPGLARKEKTKSVAAAALLGLLLPGAGLLYAAPLSAAAIATVAVIVVVKMTAAFPLIGWLLSSVALGLCAVATAVLNAVYVKQYNRAGKRIHLPSPPNDDWSRYAESL